MSTRLIFMQGIILGNEFDKTDIINYIDTIICKAIDREASDIHIEPEENGTRVRYRIDGDLVTIDTVDSTYHQALVTRLKIMSNLDIAERRLPQDGRITYDEEGGVDLRLAVIPTINGEKAVIRILNRERYRMGIEEFGFPESTLKRLRRIISRSSGMLISSGPTGCGKSTTLYSLISELNSESRNILTVEDPVEYKMNGINQMQVNEKAGMTFSTGLRAMLRADPDVIMVGEIRDPETAETAIRAAITGHLVISTIHTYDSFSSIIRLLDMGIQPYLIASALIGVQSQRLVKKLCPHCSKKVKPTTGEYAILSNFFELDDDVMIGSPVGCDKCIGGFRGRQVISEVFEVDLDIIKLIKSCADISELRAIGAEKGMSTMLEDGLSRVLKGEVYIGDVLKETYNFSGDTDAE